MRSTVGAMISRLLVLLVAAPLAGCASFSDSRLVPGMSTGADVEAMFGQPANRIVKPDDGSVLYYPQGPMGRKSYAVVLDANGKLQAIEQRLTDENIAKIKIGSTTVQEVRELFGPSFTRTSLPWQGLDVWENKWAMSQCPTCFGYISQPTASFAK